MTRQQCVTSLFYNKEAQDLLEDRISEYGGGFVWRKKINKLSELFTFGKADKRLGKSGKQPGKADRQPSKSDRQAAIPARQDSARLDKDNQ